MKIRQVLTALLRSRPGAPWVGYILPALVAMWFGLWGFGEEGLAGAWPYAIILAVCVIQIRYRTVVGWVFVLLPCAAYTVAVGISPGNGPLGEYFLFLLSGLVPSVLLIVANPFRTVDSGKG